jgi:hypothetical protein
MTTAKINGVEAGQDPACFIHLPAPCKLQGAKSRGGNNGRPHRGSRVPEYLRGRATGNGAEERRATQGGLSVGTQYPVESRTSKAGFTRAAFPGAPGTGRKSWEPPRPPDPPSHSSEETAPPRHGAVSAQLVWGSFLSDNPHGQGKQASCLRPSEGDGRAGVGRGQLRVSESAMEAPFRASRLPIVGDGGAPGRCQPLGTLPSPKRTLAFANGASEGSAVSPDTEPASSYP